MEASDLADIEPSRRKIAADLLEEMKGCIGAKLFMDRSGIAANHYRRKLGGSSLGILWAQQMASLGKVEYVERSALDRRTRVRLEDCHLDPEDLRYVRLAASTPTGMLVTHDARDYSREVARVLRRRLNVTLLNADSARKYLTENP